MDRETDSTESHLNLVKDAVRYIGLIDAERRGIGACPEGRISDYDEAFKYCIRFYLDTTPNSLVLISVLGNLVPHLGPELLKRFCMEEPACVTSVGLCRRKHVTFASICSTIMKRVRDICCLRSEPALVRKRGKTTGSVDRGERACKSSKLGGGAVPGASTVPVSGVLVSTFSPTLTGCMSSVDSGSCLPPVNSAVTSSSTSAREVGGAAGLHGYVDASVLDDGLSTWGGGIAGPSSDLPFVLPVVNRAHSNTAASLAKFDSVSTVPADVFVTQEPTRGPMGPVTSATLPSFTAAPVYDDDLNMLLESFGASGAMGGGVAGD